MNMSDGFAAAPKVEKMPSASGLKRDSFTEEVPPAPMLAKRRSSAGGRLSREFGSLDRKALEKLLKIDHTNTKVDHEGFGPRDEQARLDAGRKDTIEDAIKNFEGPIQESVSAGWRREDAEIYWVLQGKKAVLAKALRDGDRLLAASNYALCEVLFRRHEQSLKVHTETVPAFLSLGQRRLSGVFDPSSADTPRRRAILPPKMYQILRGDHSLVDGDPAWAKIEKPDRTGFCGLTSDSLVLGTCRPEAFMEGGFGAGVNKDLPGGKKVRVYEEQDSDIVCFEPAYDDIEGCRSPILTKDNQGVFPPNTLFRLKEIKQPGTWESPNPGVFPKRRLLVVSALFQRPSLRRELTEGASTGKLCGSVTTLQYANRIAYVDGLDDILAKPVLTMELEFDRDFTWVDWKGKEYKLREEWAYVCGPADPKKGCTPGTRDEGNGGRTPDDFLKIVNKFIQDRRAEDRRAEKRIRLAESDGLLTRDEVLAIRLYSGPAYQPINDFLRQISALSGRYRTEVAEHAGITFTATVRHIVWGIRKLAAHRRTGVISSSSEPSAACYRRPSGSQTRRERSVASIWPLCRLQRRVRRPSVTWTTRTLSCGGSRQGQSRMQAIIAVRTSPSYRNSPRRMRSCSRRARCLRWWTRRSMATNKRCGRGDRRRQRTSILMATRRTGLSTRRRR